MADYFRGNAPSHKETPPRHRLGGRTQPAIELLTDVSKAGSWRQIAAGNRVVDYVNKANCSYNPISRANF